MGSNQYEWYISARKVVIVYRLTGALAGHLIHNATHLNGNSESMERKESSKRKVHNFSRFGDGSWTTCSTEPVAGKLLVG